MSFLRCPIAALVVAPLILCTSISLAASESSTQGNDVPVLTSRYQSSAYCTAVCNYWREPWGLKAGGPDSEVLTVLYKDASRILSGELNTSCLRRIEDICTGRHGGNLTNYEQHE